MTSPHLFDSDWEYYESLLTPAQCKVNDILDNDPVEYLIDHGLIEDFVDEYFEEVFDYAVDRGFVQEYIEAYVKENEMMDKEG